MSCRPHEFHRRPCFGQRPPAVDKSGRLSRRQPLHHSSQRRSRTRRVIFLQGVKIKDGVRNIRSCGRHILFAQDVPPAQFHETAAVRQAGETCIDETRPRQAVQHHVHTFSTRGFKDLLPERCLPAVEHVRHAQRPEICLFRRAGGGEDFRSRGLCQLDGGQPHATCTGVNQYPVAGLQFRKFERQHTCREHRGKRGERCHRHVRWGERHQFFPCNHFRTECAERQADHAIADRDGGHAGAHLYHVTAHLLAQQPFLNQAHCPEYIEEVEPAGFDRNANLVRLQGTFRQRQHLQFFDSSPRVGRQHPVGTLGQGKAVRVRARTHQPRRPARLLSVGDVGLGVRVKQFIREAVRQHGSIGVEVDHARLQLCRLPGHNLAETPQRCAGEFP